MRASIEAELQGDAIMKRIKGHWPKVIAVAVTCVTLLSVFMAGFVLRGVLDNKKIVFWNLLATTELPESCALCGGIPHHAPSLVNLSTGEVGEMVVYDPDLYLGGEIAEFQQTGTFSLVSCAGASGIRDADAHTCEVTIFEKAGLIDPSYFCGNCRTLLTRTAVEGYVLADLYDLDHIQIYAVEEGAEYTIRDYTVSMSLHSDLEGLTVSVQGEID